MKCQNLFIFYYVEGDLDEAQDEEDLLAEIEVEQAPPVVPIPAPVEPPVKRKRGRPPKSKPDSKYQTSTVLPVAKTF